MEIKKQNSWFFYEYDFQIKAQYSIWLASRHPVIGNENLYRYYDNDHVKYTIVSRLDERFIFFPSHRQDASSLGICTIPLIINTIYLQSMPLRIFYI